MIEHSLATLLASEHANDFWGNLMAATALVICAVLIAVDGDTVKCDGEKLRDIGDGAPFVLGFDAPEIGGKARCVNEVLTGSRATTRYQELLLTPGVTIEDTGQRDTTQDRRRLVVIRLTDGRALGTILIQEGLAREWRPGKKNDWCAGS